MTKKLSEQVADIEAGKQAEHTMGAQVGSTPCSICGSTKQHTHKRGGDVVIQDGVSHVELICFSLMSAPKCGECGEGMRYTTRGTDWACSTPFCPQEGVVITTGVGGVIRERGGP